MQGVARELYATATRAGDNSTRLDVIRLMTVMLKKDEDYRTLEEEVMKVPESPEQIETLLFLKMRRLVYAARYTNEKQRQEKLVKLLAHIDDEIPQNNKGANGLPARHEKMFRLFTVVEYLRNDAPGDLLKKYLDELIEMAQSEEFDLYALENLLYTEAANIYSDADDEKKAVEADRRMLKIIDRLEESYKKAGRTHRNFDVNRYTCYRRMIRNYEGLTPGEIKDIHAKCLQLAETNSDVHNDMENTPRFYAYYYMATGDYKAAIPHLRNIIRRTDEAPLVRKQALEHIITAADKTGDTTTKLEALTEYNAVLEEITRLKSEERYKELQIRYDVQNLKSQNTELELKDRENRERSQRRLMSFVLVAFVIMAVVLIFGLRSWMKFQKNAGNLGNLVDRLHNERHRLRRTLYSEYQDDPGPGELALIENDNTWSKRLKGIVNSSNISLVLTESIINDLMYIASMGRDKVEKYIEPTSIDSLLRKIESEAMNLTSGEGNFDVEYPEDDYEVTVDSECMQALMSHVMEVASRFTPTRQVALAARRHKDGFLDFLITIDRVEEASPEDPQILHDFIDAEKILAHADSGIMMCRLVALLLSSRHFVDRSYQGGTRFVFRFPADARHD